MFSTSDFRSNNMVMCKLPQPVKRGSPVRVYHACVW